MSAERIANTLGNAKREGQEWRGLCPCHDGPPRLSLRNTDDGRLLVHCFAGCDPKDILRELRRRGLIGGDDRREHRPHNPAAEHKSATRVIHYDNTTSYSGTLKKKRPIDGQQSQWLDLCRETEQLPATPGALYLEQRGVSYVGDALRWHPTCPFGKDHVGCVVALVRNILTNEPQAIHRTAIDGQGRKLSHLGSNGRLSLGPIAGGAIKLTDDVDVSTVIAIGEGIETTLSIRRLPGLERMPVWSVLSAGGIQAFPALPGIESVWIAADNDASATGQKAAWALAQRLAAAGIEPVIIIPRTTGCDLNDEAVANV